MVDQRRSLFIGKMLYFAAYAALGILVPFLNVYYKNIGLSGTQIGLINTLGPLIGILSVPFLGMLCDRLGRIRLLMGLVGLGTLVSILGIASTPYFWGIIGMTAVYNIFASALIPLVDSYNLATLGQDRSSYGRQRIWGTIGFLVTSFAIGAVLEITGLHSFFYAYGLFILLFMAGVAALPSQAARMSRSV